MSELVKGTKLKLSSMYSIMMSCFFIDFLKSLENERQMHQEAGEAPKQCDFEDGSYWRFLDLGENFTATRTDMENFDKEVSTLDEAETR